MKNILKYYFWLIVFTILYQSVGAQETTAVGQVFDSQTKAPLTNVNVYFKNTGTGIMTDNDGFFMLRTSGNETTLVFSYMGYRTREILIKRGETAGVKVELTQENKMLHELFVMPGENPAIALLTRIRLNAKRNNFFKSGTSLLRFSDQSAAFLAGVNKKLTGKKMFESLASGALNNRDSNLILPVMLNESTGSFSGTMLTSEKKETYQSSASAISFVENIFGNIDRKFSFYENSINVMGQNFISPVATGSGLYYNYYLTDSLMFENRKLYQIKFKSKNVNNPVLNGILSVDSASAAIENVHAELPMQSGINFIQQLTINQQFKFNGAYLPSKNEIYIRLNQKVIKDSTLNNPVLLLKKVVRFSVDSVQVADKTNFAGSGFAKPEIEQKLTSLENSPEYKAARYIAGIFITGYIPVGFLDIGKIQQIVRVNDVEGWRWTLPFKTNEKLLRDLALGGYAGYGFNNKKWQYSGSVEYRLPLKNRNLITINYTQDYRRVDYNYNNFLVKERPLLTGDNDISNSVLSLNSSSKLNLRKDLELSVNNEWNKNMETFITLRQNEMFASPDLPMQYDGSVYQSVKQNVAGVSARFSFDERVFDRHTQRIYLQTRFPVVYFGLQGGQSVTPAGSANFGKMSIAIKQSYPFVLCTINYHAEVAWMTGKVPYVYLDYPMGNEGEGYSFYKFNLMNYMEYAADKYVDLHAEFITNGWIFNNIPVIKYLNLREILTFKAIYGTLGNSHVSLLDIPTGIYEYKKPYAEIGVGITNILGLFAIQSIWRLTDLDHPGVSPWAIKTAIKISF